jgi:hypothetical protein
MDAESGGGEWVVGRFGGIVVHGSAAVDSATVADEARRTAPTRDGAAFDLYVTPVVRDGELVSIKLSLRPRDRAISLPESREGGLEAAYQELHALENEMEGINSELHATVAELEAKIAWLTAQNVRLQVDNQALVARNDELGGGMSTSS